MGKRIYINDGWEFTEKWTDSFADFSDRDEDSSDKGTDFSGRDADSPEESGIQQVRLPHTCRATPYNYFSEDIYQMVCGYRKEFIFPELKGNQRIFLVIGACAHSAEVYLNGCRIGEHHSGYTAFRTELTEFLKPGKNRLAVRADTREKQNIPPFGHVIDYMTYGGLYRGVCLEITGEARMADVFVKAEVPEDAPLLSNSSLSGGGISAPDIRKELAEISFTGTIETEFRLDLSAPDASDALGAGNGASGTVNGAEGSAEKNLFVRQTAYPYLGESCSSKEASTAEEARGLKSEAQMFEAPLSECRREKRKYLSGEKTVFIFRTSLKGAKLWDADSPSLYLVETQLVLREPAGIGESRSETVVDSNKEVIGFRRSEFRKDGYYLNGRRFPLIGLNRHQSWPYVGYAMPKSQQMLDADILKKELKVNAVRTSHYPQSPDFCRRCDELGLLVFTEIPG
ncbi:MAG: glycoside hydrolase family 2 TIM barrel-domain containing protein, partial [Eubacteriales bacterium]|nr:glycoside hydrolase family 2 TIM barrel-domain containing protein [Eubacteriales bacterium]